MANLVKISLFKAALSSRVKSPLLVIAAFIFISSCTTQSLDQAPPVSHKPWISEKNYRSQKPAEIDTQRLYDLPALIDLAQRSNPSTRIAWEKAKQAALAVGMTEAAYLPIISANIVAGHQKAKYFTPSSSESVKEISVETRSVAPTLALKWLIFDFGQRSAQLDAAHDLSFAANFTFNAFHQKLIFDVTRAYYKHSGAVATHQIFQQILDNAQAVLAAVEAKKEQGTATKTELALAQQHRAEAELNSIRARAQEQNTYQMLLAEMGVKATLKLKINTVLNRTLPKNFNGVTQQTIEAALSRRPDIQAGYAAVQAAEAGIRIARAEFAPKLYLSASLSSSTNHSHISSLPELNNQAAQQSLAIGATIPIFDGGLRNAQLKNAQSVADAASETSRKMEIDAIAEIVIASDTLKAAIAEHDASNTLVESLNITYDGALAAYQNGLGTMTSVNEASAALLNAQLAQVDAKVAAFIAATDLAFSAGSLTSADEANHIAPIYDMND